MLSSSATINEFGVYKIQIFCSFLPLNFIAMAQLSILSMFKKSNDWVGNLVWLGEPDNGMQCLPGKPTETLSESRTGNPTVLTISETFQ